MKRSTARDIEHFAIGMMAANLIIVLFRLVRRMSWTQRFLAIGLLYFGPSTLKFIVDQSEIYWYQHAYFKMLALGMVVIAGAIALFRLPQLLRWLMSFLVTGSRTGGSALAQQCGLAPGRAQHKTTGEAGTLNVVMLSDHASDMTQRRAEGRQRDYAVALQQREDILATRADQIAKRRGDLSNAWQNRHYAKAIFQAGWVGLLYLQPKPSQPVIRGPDAEENKWSSGVEGERRARARWQQLFCNRWTLICGYHNRAGEIDQILIGPGGIYAIEVKHINGEIFCDGDQWWRDKYDNYGNRVEQGVRIADRSGRGPSAQINAAADVLQGYLAKEKVAHPIMRVVVFSHEKSRIGRLDNLSVNFAATLNWFSHAHFSGSRDAQLDENAVRRVIDLIEGDHRRRAPQPRRARPDLAVD